MYDILVAEDSKSDVYLLEEALREHDLSCQLHVVADGTELMRFLDSIGREDGSPCPKLVILDWYLPLGGGPELVASVSRHSACADLPVLVLSSSASAKDREQALRSGAHEYLQKPTGLDEFLTIGGIIRQMLGGDDPCSSQTSVAGSGAR